MSNREVWADAAYEILVGVAKRYHAVIEYSQLGSEIQEHTGVTTRMGIQNWIGPVLEIVVQRCRRRGIPALTSLVVRKDSGMVGDGYDAVLRAAGIPPLDDYMQREEHAAQARLECYRWAGAPDIPSHGGKPALAPKLAATVKRRERSKRPEAIAKICPTCQMALPATGICDTC